MFEEEGSGIDFRIAVEAKEIVAASREKAGVDLQCAAIIGNGIIDQILFFKSSGQVAQDVGVVGIEAKSIFECRN